LPFLGEGRLEGKEKRAGELWVGRRRWRKVLLGLRSARNRSLPRLLGWAPAGSLVWVGRPVRVAARGRGPFYGDVQTP
jgi:hypothetical protein